MKTKNLKLYMIFLLNGLVLWAKIVLIAFAYSNKMKKANLRKYKSSTL